MNKILLISGVFLFACSGFANASLVSNGNFSSNLDNWKTRGQVKHGSGGQAVLSKQNPANENGLIRQNISLDESWTGLNVSFDFLFNKWSPKGKDVLKAFLKVRTVDDGVVSFELLNIATNKGSNWKHFSEDIDLTGLNLDYSRRNEATIVFKLKDRNKKRDAFAKIDNVLIVSNNSLTERTVPEPGSLVLLSLALAGFGYARRKKTYN